MKTNRIGNSDLKSSAIGFGCWELGGTYGTFDDKEIVEAIHRSIDLGVTLLDTAHVYGYDSFNQPDGAGRSEQLLGRAAGGDHALPRRRHGFGSGGSSRSRRQPRSSC